MKPLRASRVVPALVMTAGTALPVVTTAEILSYASSRGSLSVSASAPLTNASPAATAVPTRAASPLTTSRAAAPQATPQPTSTPSSASTPHAYVGDPVDDPFGTVQTTITVAGKKITKVSIAAPMGDPRSAYINSQVVPMLQSETLQAQNANIDVISGATETSDAYIQSLQAALSQAGL